MNFLSGLQNVQNIHPLFVHFPIALILVMLLFEVIWWLTRKSQFREFATYLLYLSAVSAVAAVVTGYIASNSLGHDTPGHDFVHEHRDVMLWMSGVLVATTLATLFMRTIREGPWRRLLIVPLLIVSALLVYGADKGGRLVFEYGVGVKAASEASFEESESHEHEDGTEKVDAENLTSMPDSSEESVEPSQDDGHVH